MKSLSKLTQILIKKRLTLATVESCSGGYLSYLLTKTPGSSKFFKGGIIAYSLDVKNKFFSIPILRLRHTQGVAEDIALHLARKIRNLFSTHIGLAIVGFAGPGAARGKRSGTVYVAIALGKKIVTKKLRIAGSRDLVRTRASMALIDLLAQML